MKFLKSRFILFFFFLIFLFNGALAGIIVVSDLDDTIKQSNVSNKFKLVINHLKGPKPFNYLLHFYRRLEHKAKKENKKITFYYLTSALSILNVETWLERNFVPPGIVQQKPFLKLFQGSFQYKYEYLKNFIMSKKDGPYEIYLFGDNGEQDAFVYNKIVNELSNKKYTIRAYVRRVKKTTVLPNIFYFDSEYDLLQESPFKEIISSEVKKEITYAKEHDLLIPSYIKDELKK